MRMSLVSVRGLPESAAARDLGMPYKKAWMLLDSINRGFTERVATAAPGGTKGLSLNNRIGRKESGWWQRRNERIGRCE